VRIALIGALGEIGLHLDHAFRRLGHTVIPFTSRRGATTGEVRELESLGSLLASGQVEAVVHAGGPGDHRGDRDWQSTMARTLAVLESSDIPSVLLSTIRVMESASADFADEAVAQPGTPYGQANAECEDMWLDGRTVNRSVLRLANVFARPTRPNSPQERLLPWSLLEEIRKTSCLHIRSGGNAVKSFVGPADIAHALLLMLTGNAPAITTTAPAFTTTLGELSMLAAHVFEEVSGHSVDVSFGVNTPERPMCRTSWLTEHGWKTSLQTSDIESEIRSWIHERGVGMSSA
jgi:nucleoside-diphosphate-sugar epimerase